jgi:hypothetical protein
MRGGVDEGELGEQHGDVIAEPVAGVRAEQVKQLVGGLLQVRLVQRLDLLVQPEEVDRCAAANTAAAAASTGPAARPPRSSPGTGPADSGQMPSPARSGRWKTARQDRRGTGRPAPLRSSSGSEAAASAAAKPRRVMLIRLTGV